MLTSPSAFSADPLCLLLRPVYAPSPACMRPRSARCPTLDLCSHPRLTRAALLGSCVSPPFSLASNARLADRSVTLPRSLQSSSASTRVQVAIVESLALVPHTSQTDQQHETAPVDIDAVYYQYGAMRQSQEAKRTPAGRGAPALDDGYSSSPTPQSEGARQPRDRSEGASHRGQTRSNGSERAALSSDEPSQAGQVREATAYQRRPQPPVQDDAYSPYFQQPGAVGQVEETDDVGTDVSGDEEDDEGRFQEIANGESDQFDYDPAQTQFGAGPALANSSGEWTSNGDEPRAGTSGGHDDAAEQVRRAPICDWTTSLLDPLTSALSPRSASYSGGQWMPGRSSTRSSATASRRSSPTPVRAGPPSTSTTRRPGSTAAEVGPGFVLLATSRRPLLTDLRASPSSLSTPTPFAELAQRFADLNKVITNYAAGSTANFAAIMEDVAAYERDQQRVHPLAAGLPWTRVKTRALTLARPALPLPPFSQTARKLEGYAQDLEKWGADITSTSRQ